jgi:hypothetical protein
MPRALAVFLATAVGLFLASPALADPAPDSDGLVWDTAPTPKMRWYGWQTLLADAASCTIAIAGGVVSGADSSRGSRTAGDVVSGVGGAGYFLGAPIVHAAHGQWGSAAESFVLRLGLPLGGALAGGLLGLAACGSSSGEVPCPAVVAGVGAVAGAIAAPFVDAFAVAYEPVPRVSHEAAVAPTVSIVRGGGSVGLVGQF